MSKSTEIIETYPIWQYARMQVDCCDKHSQSAFASGAVWGKATTLMALSYACQELGLDIHTKVELERKIEERIRQEKEFSENYVNN